MFTPLSEEEILQHRIHKLKAEIEAARRIKELGLDPLQLWDQLTHSVLEMAKEGLRKQFPEYSEKDIQNLLRTQVDLYSSKPRKKNGRTC
jgi:hypothetical protein